jgi:hypothetical protein
LGEQTFQFERLDLAVADLILIFRCHEAADDHPVDEPVEA